MADAPGQRADSGKLAALAELVRAIGGALLAFVAVVALVLLALTTIGDLDPDSRGEAFVAVVGAISTIVGGYVGLKIGAAGKEEATQGRAQAEQAKDAAKEDVAILLGKLPEGQAEAVRRDALSSV